MSKKTEVTEVIEEVQTKPSITPTPQYKKGGKV
jgi:hypothetical protein